MLINEDVKGGDMVSAAGELRISEDSAAVEGVSILPDVGLLVVELSLSHLVHELGSMTSLIEAVGCLVELLAEIGSLVLLGFPDPRTSLSGHLEDFRTTQTIMIMIFETYSNCSSTGFPLC